MTGKFTEKSTEHFYDTEDALYRSFWDKEGALHWGIFDETTGDDFLKACANLNNIMAKMSLIDQDSRVLDLGCGNGTTSMWLCESLGCRVLGIDLSGVRIGNARENLQRHPHEIRLRAAFEKGSATALPFDDGSFTHVWSQATIYHVHDKEKALKEAYRVLMDDGIFIFDDLTKPKPDIGELARTYVYDRLLFDTDFSFESYQEGLEATGFRILTARDLSNDLKTSYSCLEKITGKRSSENPDEKYQSLCYAYGQMVRAVENGELGWGLYLCRK